MTGTDVRQWFHYPIQIPLSIDGQGPATVGVDAASITYEVWDVLLNTHASFSNLPDAINEAMRLNAALDPTPDPKVQALVDALRDAETALIWAKFHLENEAGFESGQVNETIPQIRAALAAWEGGGESP